MSYKIHWRCFKCGKASTITFPQKLSGQEIMRAIFKEHDLISRNCKSLLKGFPDSQYDFNLSITEIPHFF